jgi:hypothetical protein
MAEFGFVSGNDGHSVQVLLLSAGGWLQSAYSFNVSQHRHGVDLRFWPYSSMMLQGKKEKAENMMGAVWGSRDE